MDKEKLNKHVSKLCRKNLKDVRVKCCAECPFEDIIVKEFPDLKNFFEIKRLSTIRKSVEKAISRYFETKK